MIEVYADVWCPFTHVGLRRVLAERERRGSEVGFRVRAWPLELVNGEPLDPAFVAEEVDELRAQVAPELFAGFDPAHFPSTTLGALRLTHAAYERDLEVGEAVALELRDRLFERGQDVGDPEVLAAVAASHGLDPPAEPEPATDPVALDRDRGAARGVTGSPHFFTPDGDFFCPSLEIERVDGELRIRHDPETFVRFVDACFG